MELKNETFTFVISLINSGLLSAAEAQEAIDKLVEKPKIVVEKPRRRHVTPNRRKEVRKLYQDDPDLPTVHAAKILGCSVETIRQDLKALKLRYPKKRRFTEEENQRVVELTNQGLTAKEIADRMGRPQVSIEQAQNRLTK